MAGRPYDTLEEVIGLRGTPGHGGLAEWGVTYRELPLAPGGGLDWDALATAVGPSEGPPPGTHLLAWRWRLRALLSHSSTPFDMSCNGAGTRLALIQRSCGYALRPTLTTADIERAVALIHAQSPGCVVAVDNCYGEFTEAREPCAVGIFTLCAG